MLVLFMLEPERQITGSQAARQRSTRFAGNEHSMLVAVQYGG